MNLWLPLAVCLVGAIVLAWKKQWIVLATYAFAVGLLVLLLMLPGAHVGVSIH